MGDPTEAKNLYLELNVHGRVMFTHITSKLISSTISDTILKTVAFYASESLNQEEIPFGKGGVTVKAILDHYIAPKLAKFISQNDFSIKPDEIFSISDQELLLDNQQIKLSGEESVEAADNNTPS